MGEFENASVGSPPFPLPPPPQSPNFFAKARSVGNVNLASSPATFDGVTPDPDDVIFINEQTDKKEAGLYTFNGAGNPLVRIPEFDSTLEMDQGARVWVSEGSAGKKDKEWNLESNSPVVGVDDIIFIEVPQPSLVQSQNTLWVDTTKSTGPGVRENRTDQYATISLAITDASAGDIIRVAPGAYAEALTVNKALHIDARGVTGITSINLAGGSLHGYLGFTEWDANGAIIHPTNSPTVNGLELLQVWAAGKTITGLSATNGFRLLALGSDYFTDSTTINMDTEFMTLEGEGSVAWERNWFHGMTITPFNVAPASTPDTNITVTQNFGPAIAITKSKLALKRISLPTVHNVATINITFDDAVDKGEGFVMEHVFSPVHVTSSVSLRFDSEFTGNSVVWDCFFSRAANGTILAGVTSSAGQDWGGHWKRVCCMTVPLGTFVTGSVFDDGIASYIEQNWEGMFGQLRNSWSACDILDMPGSVDGCVHTAPRRIDCSGTWTRSWFAPGAGGLSIISGTLSNGECQGNTIFINGELTTTGLVVDFISPIAGWMEQGAVKSLGTFLRSSIGTPPNTAGGSSENCAVKIIDCRTQDMPIDSSHFSSHPFEGEMRGGSYDGIISADDCKIDGVRFTGARRRPKPVDAGTFMPSWILPRGHWGNFSGQFLPTISVPVAGTYRITFNGGSIGTSIFGVGKSFVFEGYGNFPGLNGTHTITAEVSGVSIDIAVGGAAVNTLGALSGAAIAANVLTLTFAAPHGINGAKLDVSGIGFVTTDPNGTTSLFTAPTTTTLTVSLPGPNETFTTGAETIIQLSMHTLDNSEIYQIGGQVDITNCSWQGLGISSGALRFTSEQIIHKSLSIKNPASFSDDSIKHGCDLVQLITADHSAHYGQDIIHVDTALGNVVVTCKPEDQHRTFSARKITGDVNTVRVNDDSGTQIGPLLNSDGDIFEYYTDKTTIRQR